MGSNVSTKLMATAMAGSQGIHPLGCLSTVKVFYLPKLPNGGYMTDYPSYMPMYGYDKVGQGPVTGIKKRYISVEGAPRKGETIEDAVQDPNNYNKLNRAGPTGFWSVADYSLENETILCVYVDVKNLVNGFVHKARAIKYLYFDSKAKFITMNIHLPKDERLPLDTVHISGKFNTLGQTNLEYLRIGPVAWDNKTKLYDNFLVEKGLLSFNSMQDSDYVNQHETILTTETTKRTSQYDISGLI